MEVDKFSFYPLLLEVLTDIGQSRFVAFDLELSGVPSKSPKNYTGSGKPSLQDRYLETKEAAEHYAILQIGLTCVLQDIQHQKYILKPYNFELNPIIEPRGVDVERIFSFQSGAVDFLLRSGFDMSIPFHYGISYLSRQESKEARDKFHKRQDKSSFADIQIKPTEVESLAFLERVRQQVKEFLPTPSTYVNIGKTLDDPDTEDADLGEGLSRFEKRLVHQLIRAEFPDLVTISRHNFIQIVRFDKKREERVLADRLKELNERLDRQKGFRWIVEALAGSQLSNIDLKECARDPANGEHIFADMDEFRAQFHRAHAQIRGNPRTLIGHNCFLDLVYIYRAFIGPLPDTVEGFQNAIHSIWPDIVDTKYMSTHNCGDMKPVSSLDQIASQLSVEQRPTLEIGKEHMKYSEKVALHEAGYDSFLTAQIALRLSAKLNRNGDYAESPTSPDSEKATLSAFSTLHLDESVNGHANGTAPDVKPDVGFTPSVEGGKWKRKGDPSLGPSDPNDPFAYRPTDRIHQHRDEVSNVTFPGGMPGRASEFWRVYGNRLRVFGTEEGMCILDGSGEQNVGRDGDDGGVKVV